MTAERNEIVLRPARADDFEFIRHVHRSCFKTYVEQTWGNWDEADQLERIRRARWLSGDIIVLHGREIGLMAIEDQGTALFLELIALLPQYQTQGLGTKLIQQLLANADARAIPVQLSVLKVNPARALYERLGFRVVGEDEQRWYMERAYGTTGQPLS
jgi:ribosomal protein S18 acetylase RimI-like enzyme